MTASASVDRWKMSRKIAERTVVGLASEYAARFPDEVATELASADHVASGGFVARLPTSVAVSVVERLSAESLAGLLAAMPDEALRRIAPGLERTLLERALVAADRETRERLEEALASPEKGR